ncbi:histone-lysine N-methyltransferase SMYD3 [Macrosteles quadrilineatus]|uniref:histone-lysine N-methyltransferase SMYD3 n=1 Tax=Macrosteles quadrilineatus TaxID=74068 RepID=UPI0023E1F479|nr:histone-lysine N-methyltransferase SMYD3 [Macrosteles quadrilineatus]
MKHKTKNNCNSSVRKGQILLKESPFVYGLKSSLRYERCDFCFSSTQVLKCTACKYVSYCNRVCQTNGWEVHRDECQNLKKISPRVVPDAARILARLVFKLKRGGGTQRGFYTKTNFRVFKDLMSHYSDIKEDKKRMEHFTSLYNVLVDFIGEDNVPNSAELLGIYGRLVVNGFNILDPEMMTIGTGIYLGVSIIDHSCDPTAVAVFSGTTILVRSLVDMPELDWSKVFISYIELLNSPEERQQELLATYYFLCQCARCLDVEEVKLNNSMVCPNSSCGSSVPVPSKKSEDEEISSFGCSKCKENVKPELYRRFLEVSEFVGLQLENMKTFSYLDVAKTCLEKQGEMFHPLNLQRVKVLDAAFESSISVNQWSDAREFGKLLLPGYRRYYGELHPLTGILQLKLGKICVFLNHCDEARQFLRAAESVLSVTHGREHSLYTEHLLPLLMQSQ